MKRKILWYWLILVCWLVCPLVSRAQAQTPTAGFQVSLVDPLQLHPDDYNIDGFRFNLIYGSNQDVGSVDIGFINEAEGNVHGFELGLDNRVAKRFEGLQFGLFNEVKRGFSGVELGLANITLLSCEGLQVGAFNDVQEEMRGLQIGVINHAESLVGIQIGLLNFNDDSKYLGFFPFINAAF